MDRREKYDCASRFIPLFIDVIGVCSMGSAINSLTWRRSKGAYTYFALAQLHKIDEEYR
jgi:hypothetical protein